MDLVEFRVYLGEHCAQCSMFNVNYSVVCDNNYKPGRAKVSVNVVHLCGLCVYVNIVALCGYAVKNVALGT